MLIKAIDLYVVNLPFNFSFGHSLAKRSSSQNIIVKVTLADGSIGYGEGIPREYVTGESVSSALKCLAQDLVPVILQEESNVVSQLNKLTLPATGGGAAWCALELAILDACARSKNLSLAEVVGKPLRNEIKYDGVVPFARREFFLAILLFYKFYGFETVKLKLGANDDDNLFKVKTARAILGNSVKLRVDVNSAWTLDQALRSAEFFRPYNVLSYEQPFAGNAWEDLQKLTAAIPEEVVLDESLRTVDEAQSLAQQRVGSGFNIRLSKVGGITAAKRIVEIASNHNINCHLGAQVGESAILSSAGRIFACTQKPFANYEGSANRFLLKNDLAQENLTASWGGKGVLDNKPGLGITVLENRLESLAIEHKKFTLGTVDIGKAALVNEVVGVR